MAPYPSLAAVGPDVGRVIGCHLVAAFRAVARGNGIVDHSAHFRLISREAHPLGNFAPLRPTIERPSACAAVDPLVAAAVPAAELFPGSEAPPDVVAVLVERGYVPHGAMPAMGIDIA